MSVSWRLEAGLLCLESDERATFDGWRTAVEAGLRAACDSNAGVVAVVHDLRRMARVPSLREANARVAWLVKQSRAYGVRRWASVVRGLDNLAMAQTAEMAGAGQAVEFRVFEDLAEAQAWARGAREAT
jgi:hypothetical protein